MALQMILLKCPSCNADLQIEADRKQAFCTYCGAKILIDNTNEHIIRTIDEAKIREAEYKYQLKQLQIKEDKKEDKKRFCRYGIMFGMMTTLVGFSDATLHERKEMYLLAIVGVALMIFSGYILLTSNKDE